MTNPPKTNPLVSSLPPQSPPHSLPLHLLLLLTLLHPFHSHSSTIPPPLPILPIPTFSQLSWQQSEMALFLHFGPNTFTDSEWGTGHADPSVFSPTQFNPKQWVAVANSSGFSRLILTAKHHDGFCLWPSDLTNYSVKSTPWMNGTGDIVGSLSAAVNDAGLQLGLYLSPWDRHEPAYGKTLEYNEYYMGQMAELLIRYGEIKEVWLDGAKGKGEKYMEYFFDRWFGMIRQLQAGAVIFSDAGPDTRWIGDEYGTAGSTCWSMFNRSDAKIGGTDPKYSQGGDPFGLDWVPPECDVSIRPGWFWHPSESPKSAQTLLDIYYNSVGRNCLLLLNVPPNTSGLISNEDIKVLKEFSDLRHSIFSKNLAADALITASSVRGGPNNTQFAPHLVLDENIHTYWAPEENGSGNWVLSVDLGNVTTFNVVQIREPIQMGQRIVQFSVDVVNGEGKWVTIVGGTTVGYKRLLLFERVQGQYLRFVVEKSRSDPLVSYFGVHLDPYSSVKKEKKQTLFRSIPVIGHMMSFFHHLTGAVMRDTA